MKSMPVERRGRAAAKSRAVGREEDIPISVPNPVQINDDVESLNLRCHGPRAADEGVGSDRARSGHTTTDPWLGWAARLLLVASLPGLRLEHLRQILGHEAPFRGPA